MIMVKTLYKAVLAVGCGLLFMACSAGKSLVRLAQNKKLEQSNIGLPVYHIPDYSFVDLNSGAALDVNGEGLFIGPDSSLLSAIVYMYLTTEDSMETVYGCSYGKVLDGRKEGLWTKDLFVDGKRTAKVRQLNYHEGQLDGVMFYYKKNGDRIFPYIDYQTRTVVDKYNELKDGTGAFLDYHSENGQTKVLFHLKNGRLINSYVEFYDNNGFRIIVDRYFNGYRINY